MTIQELQVSVDKWIKTYGVRYFEPLTNMAILTEETGELARLMSRIYGEQSFKVEPSEEEKKDKLADEMADILWVLTCLANQSNIDLGEAIEKNIRKKTQRDQLRHRKNPKLK